MTRPPVIWLLDVDGVVNLMGRRPRDGVRRRVDGLTITWRRSVVWFINEAHRSGKADVRWLKTWGHSAATELAPALGLDDFAVEGPDDFGTKTRGIWWKVETVVGLRKREPHARILWTDDDLGLMHRRDDWLRTNESVRSNVTTLAPLPLVGLTDKDLASITAVLDAT